jgi:hypothetical protein
MHHGPVPEYRSQARKIQVTLRIRNCFLAPVAPGRLQMRYSSTLVSLGLLNDAALTKKATP